MVLLARRSVFAAKLEATVGTAEALANADGVFNALDVELQPTIEMEDREGQGGFAFIPGVPGMRSGTITFSTELSYDGTNIPTWASILLPACGFVNAAGVFTPRSAGPGTLTTVPRTVTLGHYQDGKLKTLAGCMGNVVFEFPVGRMARANWTFTGKWANPTDASIIGPTYPTTKPLRFAAGSFSWNSNARCVETASIDAGNEVVARECPGDATGIANYLVTSRRPVITANPETVLVATENRHSDWLEMEPRVLTITLNSVGNSTLVFSAPAAQIQNIQQADRSGILADEIEWLATRGATPDTELSITFNADTT